MFLLHCIQCPLQSLFLFYPIVTYKSSASKYQRMPQCHIPVPICWLFLILGLVDLGIGLGQPQFSTKTVPFLPTMSPPCGFASHFLPCNPLLKWVFSLLGGILNEGTDFWHFTHYLWGYTGSRHFHTLALTSVLIAVYLHHPLEDFLLFVPIIVPLPTSSVLVWQCQIQCAHFHLTIFQ